MTVGQQVVQGAKLTDLKHQTHTRRSNTEAMVAHNLWVLQLLAQPGFQSKMCQLRKPPVCCDVRTTQWVKSHTRSPPPPTLTSSGSRAAGKKTFATTGCPLSVAECTAAVLPLQHATSPVLCQSQHTNTDKAHIPHARTCQ